MPKILEKYVLAPKTHYIRIEAPLIARHAKPGQFVVVRLDDQGERVPFTIADIDPEAGTITLVVQEIGKTSEEVGKLNTGDDIRDVLGPLGMPSEVEAFGTVVLLGGGFGIAAIHLLAKALRKHGGNKIIAIVGARTQDLLLMEKEMAAAADEMIIMTDDGSVGRKGLVTQPLKEMLERGDTVNHIVAVGPIPMMRAVSDLTRPYGVKTIVSLNPIMVDGTGMCGGCRVQIGPDTKFACVDGPEFDGHLTNFDELTMRNAMYKPQQEVSTHRCKLDAQVENCKCQLAEVK